MSDFKIFSSSELLDLLTDRDLVLLHEFQKHLTELRSGFRPNYRPVESRSEAYLTAWMINWVDFRKEPITDLYKIDFEKRSTEYRKMYYAGLVSTAKLKWHLDFNGLIDPPDDHRLIFGKGKKK